jgi:hypothetical protein
MKVPYVEGLANHNGPESCGAARPRRIAFSSSSSRALIFRLDPADSLICSWLSGFWDCGAEASRTEWESAVKATGLRPALQLDS